MTQLQPKHMVFFVAWITVAHCAFLWFEECTNFKCVFKCRRLKMENQWWLRFFFCAWFKVNWLTYQRGIRFYNILSSISLKFDCISDFSESTTFILGRFFNSDSIRLRINNCTNLQSSRGMQLIYYLTRTISLRYYFCFISSALLNNICIHYKN